MADAMHALARKHTHTHTHKERGVIDVLQEHIYTNKD